MARAYKDSVAFSNENYGFQMEPVIGRTLIQMGGREHSVNRSLVTPALRGHYLDSFLPRVSDNATSMIDNSSFRNNSLARSIRRFRNHAYGDIPVRFRNRCVNSDEPIPRTAAHRCTVNFSLIIWSA